MEGAGRRRQIFEISAVCPVVCVDGEMSADSADKRQRRLLKSTRQQERQGVAGRSPVSQ